jgi:hypothetical protein
LVPSISCQSNHCAGALLSTTLSFRCRTSRKVIAELGKSIVLVRRDSDFPVRMGLSATVTASTVGGPCIEVVKARGKSKMACRVRAEDGFTADRWRPVLLDLATAEPETHKAGGPNDRGRLVARTADLLKLFGSPSRRHDRTSPAAADVSTADTL